MDIITADNLNAYMENGTVIRVNLDGTVDVRPDDVAHVPWDILVGTLDSDGTCTPSFDAEILAELPEHWEPMRGYTGQYGADSESFIMHESEFIGGGLARDILATPGLYVAIVVDGMTDDEDAETEPVGWLVARADLP